jgi:hypothetical protein
MESMPLVTKAEDTIWIPSGSVAIDLRPELGFAGCREIGYNNPQQ